MKKTPVYLITLVLLFIGYSSIAQPGIVHTIAGGGTSTAEGVPALNSYFSGINAICMDSHNNMYVCDYGANKIRKIDATTGLVHTIAGNGIAGFSGDGGPATNAKINLNGIYGFCADDDGNVYFPNRLDLHVRKIDGATGIISTVAGGGTLVGNGIPATDAGFVDITAVNCDKNGNIYIADRDNFYVFKVNIASGIISIAAGSATATTPGDGGSATNAQLVHPRTLAFDHAGNLYICQELGYIRKIGAITGIITTIYTTVGSGTVQQMYFDLNKNIYWSGLGPLMKRDGITGAIYGLSGEYPISGEAEGLHISNTNASGAHALWVDVFGNIYYANSSKIRKINSFSPGMTSYAGSFQVYANSECDGPDILIQAPVYLPGEKIVTSFGDGIIDTTVVLSGIGGGYCKLTHSYAHSGGFHIKHILYSGGSIALDSFSFDYTYSFCRSLPIKLFPDLNGNCLKDPGEHYNMIPLRMAIDSNGVPVDTISVTSGITYNAYGSPGDQFRFNIQPGTTGFSVVCPTSGFVTDTLSLGVNTTRYLGLSCASGYFDLSVSGTVYGTGMHMQEGAILFYNASCTSADADVTLHFSPKYTYAVALPLPDAVSPTSITWHRSDLLIDNYWDGLYYKLVSSLAGSLAIGDTVHTRFMIGPTLGDVNTANNQLFVVDTVRSGYDPNSVDVFPNGCMGGNTRLEYTIHFENTGNDTAHNIYVLDTLSEDIDPSTIHVIAASAEMFISVNKVNGYSVVKFDFPAINLLDSSHHGECDGMVTFSVSIKNSLPAATHIFNRAGIYFDVNPVVMTNIAENVTTCWPSAVPVVVKNQPIQLYPNPVSSELTIETARSIFTSFTISNSLGQVVLQQNMNGVQAKVDVKALSPGLYFVTLRGSEGNEVQKFIKW